jgi:O-antigen/teichoic acid export membrane protein
MTFERKPIIPPKKPTNVHQGAIWSTALQYIGTALQFISAAVLARYFLTPAETGLFSIAMAATLMLTIFQDFGLTRYIASLPSLSPATLARCTTLAVALGSVIALILVALSWPMATLYKAAQLAPVMWLAAASCFISAFSIVPTAILARAMAFYRLGLIQLGATLAQTIVALSLAAGGLSTAALAYALLAAAIVRAGLSQYLSPAIRFSPFSRLGPIIRFGSANAVLTLSGALGTRIADLIIGKLLGLAPVGYYSRAASLSDQSRTLMIGSMGAVLFPAFAQLHREGKPLAPGYLRVCAAYSGLIWPAMAGLALCSDTLVRLVFGPAWAPVAPALQLIAVSQMLIIAVPLAIELPILVGKMRALLARNVIDTALSISLLALGCNWGVEGAAASRIVYALCWLTLYYPFMRSIVGFSPRALALIYAKSCCVTGAALAPFICATWLGVPLSHLAPEALSLTILAGGASWLAALAMTRHPLWVELRLASASVFARRQSANRLITDKL